MTTPEQAMDAIEERFGRHARHRALHAKGVLCAGSFTARSHASRLTRAAHMSGEAVGATVRFSNGAGDPTLPDYEPDVRGLAVSFHLPDGSRTDILSQTLKRFPFKDQEGFFDALKVSKPSLGALLRLPMAAVRNPGFLPNLPRSLRTIAALPASFAAKPYYAIHAFRWVDSDGDQRWVRYTWRPTIDEPDLSRGEAKKAGADYLFDELSERLARGPARMDLEVQIAGEGDDPHDPSSVWPAERERVVVGTLEVGAIDPSADDGIVFDPMRLTDGIEASDDRALRFRPPVYTLSHARRAS